MLRRLLIRLLPVAVFALSALAGCNTMRGFGQDMERGGEKIQNKAEQNR